MSVVSAVVLAFPLRIGFAGDALGPGAEVLLAVPPRLTLTLQWAGALQSLRMNLHHI